MSFLFTKFHFCLKIALILPVPSYLLYQLLNYVIDIFDIFFKIIIIYTLADIFGKFWKHIGRSVTFSGASRIKFWRGLPYFRRLHLLDLAWNVRWAWSDFFLHASIFKMDEICEARTYIFSADFIRGEGWLKGGLGQSAKPGGGTLKILIELILKA